jgi:hypothetical protein
VPVGPKTAFSEYHGLISRAPERRPPQAGKPPDGGEE